MTLDDLKSILPPPEMPKGTAGLTWRSVEAYLKIGLPDDYKDFIATYGTGKLVDFIGIYSPFCKDKYANLISMAPFTSKMMNYVDGDYPYPFYPSPGGLLIIGTTDHGDMIFWCTKGAPSEWTIVVSQPRADSVESFDWGFVEFLIRVLTGDLKPVVFPDDLFLAEMVYQPYEGPCSPV